MGWQSCRRTHKDVILQLGWGCGSTWPNTMLLEIPGISQEPNAMGPKWEYKSLAMNNFSRQ